MPNGKGGMPETIAGPWITTFSSERPTFSGDMATAPLARRVRGGLEPRPRATRQRGTTVGLRSSNDSRKVRRWAPAAPKVGGTVLSEAIFRGALIRERK